MQKKFRKKPVVVDAFQLTAEHYARSAEWPDWLQQAWRRERGAPGSLYWIGDGTLAVGTLEGPLVVSPGDWIIRGVVGELYPCKPDVFALTYEAA